LVARKISGVNERLTKKRGKACGTEGEERMRDFGRGEGPSQLKGSYTVDGHNFNTGSIVAAAWPRKQGKRTRSSSTSSEASEALRLSLAKLRRLAGNCGEGVGSRGAKIREIGKRGGRVLVVKGGKGKIGQLKNPSNEAWGKEGSLTKYWLIKGRTLRRGQGAEKKNRHIGGGEEQNQSSSQVEMGQGHQEKKEKRHGITQ